VSIADELERLNQLRQSGAISGDEFAKAKAAILDGRSASGDDSPLPATLSTEETEQDARQWAMLLHFSLLAGFVVPFAGLILPIVIWQWKKSELPGMDEHGKVVMNWMISAIIYGLGCAALFFLVVPIFLLIALGICGVIFPIIGGIKASNGELWKYPLSISFLT
jgi:uncharacterized protein